MKCDRLKKFYSNNYWTIGWLQVMIVFALSHAIMIFVFGAWWDDLASCWNVSENITVEHWEKIGKNPLMCSVLLWISRLGNLSIQTYGFRLFAFTNWLISLTAFYFVIRKLTNNFSFTVIASLFAASCCISKCMFMISCFHYTMSICLFMLGLLFFVYDYYKRNVYLQFCYSILWLFSLIIWRTSILVIPALIIVASLIHVQFKWRSKDSYIHLITYVISRYYLLVISLLIFAITYVLFFKPVGDYTDYYSVKFQNVLLSPFTSITCTFYSGVCYMGEVISSIKNMSGKNILVFIAFLLFLYSLLRKLPLNKDMKISFKGLLIISVVCLYFSIMPQMLIKNIKLTFGINGYDSRLASLAMYPLSVLATCLLYAIKSKYRMLIASLSITMAIIYSNSVYIDYAKGWFRNECIASFMKSNNYLEGKKIKIVNNAIDYNPNSSGGCDTYYEYDGCARYAYGYSTKTIFSSYYSPLERDLDFVPDYYMVILRNTPPPSYKTLIFDRYFNSENYEEQIKNSLLIYTIEAEKWNSKR